MDEQRGRGWLVPVEESEMVELLAAALLLLILWPVASHALNAAIAKCASRLTRQRLA